MSTYRNYGPWSSSKTSSYSNSLDKPSSTTLDRNSRFGSSSSSSFRPTSSSYRPVPTVTSVRDRAAAVESSSSSDKPSIREKYAARTYGAGDASNRESASDAGKTSPSGTYRRFGTQSETPALRFGSSTRFGGQIARSPISEKSPTVFGVSTPSERASSRDEEKKDDAESNTIVLVTRGTSPTPPPNSAYLRTRRADMERTTQKTVSRPHTKPQTTAKEVQTDEKQLANNKETRITSVSSGISTSRSPTSLGSYSSRYSGSSYTPSSSSISSRYSPRATSYSYSRPTDLSLRSSSVSRSSSHDDAKTTPTDSPKPTEESRKAKIEGKDTERIGGFSYARPTDLPLVSSLNKTPTDNEEKSIATPSSPLKNKINSGSKESLVNSSNEHLNDKVDKNTNSIRKLNDSTVEVTTPDSTISKPTSKGTVLPKVPLSPTKLSAKLTSPDRSKLPPPVPKVDSSKSIVPNKDFRKSVLNMDLASSSESLDKRIENEGMKPLAGSKSLSKLKLSSSSPKLSQKSIDKSNDLESSSEESSSSESSESESSESDSSEEDNDSSKSKSVGATEDHKILSNNSSRISGLSSPDETSVNDKPPRLPTSPKLKTTDNRTLEAKKVVARALAPITGGIMKVKYSGSSTDELSDKSTKSNKSKDSDKDTSSEKVKKSSSNASVNKKAFRLQKIESGEKAWWMKNSSDNIPKINDEQIEEERKVFKIKRIESGEKAWWMKSTDNVPGIKSKEGQSNSPSESESVGSKSSGQKDDVKSSKISKSSSKDSLMNLPNLKRMQSGERAWWLEGSGDEKSGAEKSSDKEKSVTFSGDVSDDQTVDKSQSKNSNSMYKIKKIESGERAWWLSSSSDDQGKDKPPSNKSSDREKSVSFDGTIKRIDPGERVWRQESNKDIPGALKKSLSNKSISKSSSKSSIRQANSDNSSSRIEPVSSDREGGGFLQRIRRIESGERAWWMDSESDKGEKTESPERNGFVLRRFDSGEKDWWLDKSEEDPVETPKTPVKTPKRPKDLPLFIGRHTNIDDLLGTEAPPPAAFRTPNNSSSDEDSNSDDCLEVGADQVRIHNSVAQTPTTIVRRRGMIKLDDTALQLYKDGDYGSYLDLDASINEQQEEFEDFQTNRKNSIVLRTQLSVRVHTIIEKLLNSEGRELRRALFSLKQIFQEDKDLVHEFVQNDGLACLIKVGSDADQNYQNYILRALGQVMLYVDGMNGVIEHSPTVQWLYSLVSSKFRLVVKTALKLLLVFVEYVETNSVLLVKAIHAVDSSQGTTPWSNLMKLLKEYDAADTELLIYATSLINKTLNGLPEQDTYYDQVDALEEQGFESIIRRYMSKQGTDLDLLRQFQIYEAVLHHEDGEEKGTPLKQLDETIRKTLKHRKCLTATLNQCERRKSRRHSTGTSPHALTLNLNRQNLLNQDLNLPPDDYHNGGITRNGIHARIQNGGDPPLSNSEPPPLRRENTVKDLTQKLATTLGSPVEEGSKLNSPFSDMKGIISKAKEGLAKSQSRGDMLKSPTTEIPPPVRPPEIKKTETELQWEELVKNSSRTLSLCDLDFTDLSSGDERDVLAPAFIMNGGPPPPPPCGIPPPVPMMAPIAPTAPPPLNNMQSTRVSSPVRKNKKTVKLFWKEVRDDPLAFVKMNSRTLIWDELSPVSVDTQKLEHLFESRAKDLITKEKQQEMNKNKEIIVLDHKRSNAINIGMTKLPPPRSIKTAILKMDATVMNREGIEKLLTMLPTEEERSKIQEAQAANPDLPLGSAEQFLLTLASISELPARLKLWAFKLDFEISEKEIAEPLMDLKQGMEVLKTNKTFRAILGTLLSIGIFLNGSEVKGFQIEYLAKVPEVKDTVHKHSLLHHLCHMVMEKFPESTDLYSEIGAVTRASKVDFDELSGNLHRIETECKASFDHLKVILKHDGSLTNLKVKMSDFLADCAERIIVLSKVHRRVVNRYHKFCLWIGIPFHRVQANKPNELCRIVSEFALEYRTTRERVLQQFEKKANHRERNKTRGKMITEVGKFRSQEDRADAELRQLLGNEAPDKDTSLTGSLPWRRQRTGRTSLARVDGINGNLTDADDEIIESLVKTATKSPSTRTAPRERKRTRHADRKSLIKRSRTRDNVPVEDAVIEA